MSGLPQVHPAGKPAHSPPDARHQSITVNHRLTVFIEQPPEFVRKLYPSAVWRMDPDERAVYLTFVQIINLVAGRLSLSSIQRFARHSRSAHLLNRVAVAVTKGLDDGRSGLALHISAGQVGGVVADNLRHAGLVVAVIGDGFCTGVNLTGHREQLQGGELRVLHIVRLGLHIVQLTSEEHGRGHLIIEVHTGSFDQRSGDFGAHQSLIIVLVVSHGFLLVHTILSSYSQACSAAEAAGKCPPPRRWLGLLADVIEVAFRERAADGGGVRVGQHLQIAGELGLHVAAGQADDVAVGQRLLGDGGVDDAVFADERGGVGVVGVDPVNGGGVLLQERVHRGGVLLDGLTAGDDNAGDERGAAAQLVPLSRQVERHAQAVDLALGDGDEGLGQQGDGRLIARERRDALAVLILPVDGHVVIGVDAVLAEQIAQRVLGRGR